VTSSFVQVVDGQELLPGELARRAGVAISALHFYERQGLITSRRTSGNQRRYSRDNLADCIGCGCLSLGSCALFNPDDVLADHGPGAARL
jgi:hypothetical protein